MKNLAILLVVCLMVSCSNNSSSVTSQTVDEPVQKSPEELRMELRQQEESSPAQYLSADGTYRENFWGDKLKINCVLQSTATIATFKDVVVRITFYTKTKTVLGSEDLTIYEILKPNSRKTVELKVTNYKNVATIGWEVISAMPV